jgi:hypothetical protein
MAKGNEIRSESLPFKPRARMLVLLGEQLIRDAGIAVFELVKNAYDADATRVDVTLSHVASKEKGRVIIEDDGSGMGWDQIVNVWLEPGTDHRHQQKAKGYRTPRFGRLGTERPRCDLQDYVGHSKHDSFVMCESRRLAGVRI